ncbi:methionine/alanine import family NSS transporter small subunit [Alteribacillus bidgolensis]|uniref:Putative methionine and alanine importer, small subunit n=1 Tax=Alteribacillus bidgolensis TaxID=930129 RepID=A0A1G8RCJ8_9BACI|nr:methionine/alanine import family NSS transporter small subunit [Alteribacillus bidgolensis]SDJ14651.1 Putative methionine and alanine importer, small subunit [Alteribacillus bidgolensis]
MSMDAIVVMIFSMVLIWGGLGYFILRAFKSRSKDKHLKANQTNDIWSKDSDFQ